MNRVKATDNFFSLGGSSIRAMRLVNTARRAGFELTVTDVFTTPVLSDMAAAIRPVSSGDVGSPSKCPILTPQRPLSSSSSISISSSLITCLTQLGFVMDNVESVAEAAEAQTYMTAVTELDGEGFSSTFRMESTAGLKVAHITRACERVIQHHTLLRTVFVQYKSTLTQVALKSPPKGRVLITTEEEEGEEEEDDTKTHTLFGDRLPHFRLQVKGEKCYKLRLRIRHALYDAISLPIIIQDICAAYAQQALSRGLNFHDWLSYVNSLDTSASRKFWR